jgi:hypothetical protein
MMFPMVFLSCRFTRHEAQILFVVFLRKFVQRNSSDALFQDVNTWFNSLQIANTLPLPIEHTTEAGQHRIQSHRFGMNIVGFAIMPSLQQEIGILNHCGTIAIDPLILTSADRRMQSPIQETKYSLRSTLRLRSLAIASRSICRIRSRLILSKVPIWARVCGGVSFKPNRKVRICCCW